MVKARRPGAKSNQGQALLSYSITTNCHWRIMIDMTENLLLTLRFTMRRLFFAQRFQPLISRSALVTQHLQTVRPSFCGPFASASVRPAAFSWLLSRRSPITICRRWSGEHRPAAADRGSNGAGRKQEMPSGEESGPAFSNITFWVRNMNEDDLTMPSLLASTSSPVFFGVRARIRLRTSNSVRTPRLISA